MPITINGSGTLTGLSAGGLPDSSITSDDIAAAAVTPAKLSQPLTLATAQNTTSGTSIDFTGIPSWVRRVTVIINGISTNGSSQTIVQLGTSSGFVTTGYLSYLSYVQNAGAVNSTSVTQGFGYWNGGGTDLRYTNMILSNITGNTWVQSHSGALWNGTAAHSIMGGGNIALSGTLDRIRLTTVNGTDAFDAGSVNIMYEG